MYVSNTLKVCVERRKVKILIFGTGKYYQNRKHSFSDVEIQGFLDNSEKKIGMQLDGIRIYSPGQIQELDYDYICIMTLQYYRSVYSQLLECGVEKDRIVTYAQFIDIKDQRGSVQLFYANRKNSADNEGYILVLSHELSNTGAPMVLFQAVRILKKNGYNVEVLSLRDGPLRQKYVDEEINVWIKETISDKDKVLVDWVNSFGLLFACTLVFGEFIRETKNIIKIPILWWLHESEEFYSIWWEQSDPRPVSSNIQIYNVSARALETYKKYFEIENGNILLYGGVNGKVEYATTELMKHDKLVFLVVGVIQPRKAQDIVIDAIQHLSNEERDRVEIWFAGAMTDTFHEYEQEFKLKTEREGIVKYFGEVEHEKCLELIQTADILLCPSRDDPLPVVVAEAMMYGKTCIVSDNTGYADYIEQYQNGIVCKANARGISDTIKWSLNNKQRLELIGENGKQLYKALFSNEAFETNLMEAVESTMFKEIR